MLFNSSFLFAHIHCRVIAVIALLVLPTAFCYYLQTSPVPLCARSRDAHEGA